MLFQIHGPFEIVLANQPDSSERGIYLLSYSFPEVGDPEFKVPLKPVHSKQIYKSLNQQRSESVSVIPIEHLADQLLQRKDPDVLVCLNLALLVHKTLHNLKAF